MSFFHPQIFRYQIRDAAFYWLILPCLVLGGGRLLDLTLQLSAYRVSSLIMVLATILGSAGLLLSNQAIQDFKRYGGGTPNPRRPPKVLVQHGVYKWCRHPMFLGYDLCSLGVVLIFGSMGALMVSWPLFMLWQFLFLRKEEKYLARRFGQEFLEYCRHTHFLVPFICFWRK